jgi:hypothetical protein
MLLLPLRMRWLSTLLIVVLLWDISNYWVRYWQRIAIFIQSAIIILVVMLDYSNYFDILLIIEVFVSSTTLAYAAKNDRNNNNEKHYDNSRDDANWSCALFSNLCDALRIFWVTSWTIHIAVVGIPIVICVHVTSKVHVIGVNIDAGATVIVTTSTIWIWVWSWRWVATRWTSTTTSC